MKEKKLVSQILKGDQKAISLFYRRYKPKLLSFIKRKVADEVAEEILQDTFLSALDSLPLFKGQSSLYTWLLAIARHEIVDYYRKKKIKEVVFSRLPFLEKLASRALSPEIVLEKKELKEKIKRTFARLSEGKRKILRLKYIDRFSVASIARKLGITYKACESRLFRARVAFQREFETESQETYHPGSFVNLP